MKKHEFYNNKIYCDSICGKLDCHRNILTIITQIFQAKKLPLARMFLKGACPDYVKPTKEQKKQFMKFMELVIC